MLVGDTCFLESIHKVYFNILNPGILFKSMINNYKIFDFISYYWKKKSFNMHLSTFSWNASREYTCYNSTIELQIHESTISIRIIYFQVDEELVCMDMVLTFNYLVNTFYPFFLYIKNSNFMCNL
jgi:hypothetical protein